MKILPLLALPILFLSACDSAIKNEEKKPEEEVAITQAKKQVMPLHAPGNKNFVIKNEPDIVGFWVGMFEPDSNNTDGVSAGEYYWDYSNKINISIDKIEDGKVVGHSVVAGNDRPFSGTVAFQDGVYSFKVAEPGEQKYDGTFEFSIKKGDTLLEGSWQAFKELKISGRTYILQKRLFDYNPDLQMEEGRYVDWNKKSKAYYSESKEESDYDASYFTTTEEVTKYNASSDKLTTKQLANMKKGDLFILRNAIYARHGYSFKNQQLRAYFDMQSWYIPVATDVKDHLTELEKENIVLLLRYEKNAREYYDVFGRG